MRRLDRKRAKERKQLSDEEKIAAALRDPRAHGVTGCLLCGGPFSITALFTTTPEFGKRIGAPPGKQRVLVYGMCEGCRELPNSVELVESKILSVATVQ